MLVPPIPPTIEIAACAAIHSYTERGLSNPQHITRTCRQMAVVFLAKADIVDRKAIRYLTNRMVDTAITETLK